MDFVPVPVTVRDRNHVPAFLIGGLVPRLVEIGSCGNIVFAGLRIVEGRIAVRNSWKEDPILNVVDCELYAGPVFNNVQNHGIATVWSEA